LVEVLRIAGAIIDSSIESTYGPRIANLIRQVLDLQKIINQDIMSCDYSLFQEENGTKFDPMTALDYEFDEPALKKGRPTPGRVVCTTALGVLRLASGKDSEGVEGRNCLLKPRIVRDAYLISIKEAVETDESDDELDD
jgi:hypothetical protein